MVDPFSTNIFSVIIFSFFIISFLIYLIVRINKKPKVRSIPEYELSRESCNPLFSPQEHYEWENESTFNPAAIVDDDGVVHLFYRAIGRGGTSQIGHSISKNGIIFSERSPYPVYQAIPENTVVSKVDQVYDQIRYTSGGGWAGCEDPKTVLIDGEIYMTYVAFEGWHSIRIALTSISLKDLKKKRWNWKRPIFLSKKGEPHKNWTLFPEKVNGKFAILHCISPEILVDYVDDLRTLELTPISSRAPHDEHRNYYGRKDHWDSSVRGVGAPPIKTDIGWLVFYHAMDHRDPNKYKLGAMILDLNNPTKVLYRAPYPILSPNHHYENDSKPGVIYVSGAIVKDDNIFVYYGGGDKYVCVAQTPLSKLLRWLTTYGSVANI